MSQPFGRLGAVGALADDARIQTERKDFARGVRLDQADSQRLDGVARIFDFQNVRSADAFDRQGQRLPTLRRQLNHGFERRMPAANDVAAIPRPFGKPGQSRDLRQLRESLPPSRIGRVQLDDRFPKRLAGRLARHMPDSPRP